MSGRNRSVGRFEGPLASAEGKTTSVLSVHNKYSHIAKQPSESGAERWALSFPEEVNTATDNNKWIFAAMGIGNETVKCKINTGSTCSILPRSCLTSNKKNKKQKGNFSPTSSPNWASVLGTATVCIHNPRNKTRYTEDFVVVKDGFSPLRHTEEKILAEQPTSSRPWAR